MSNMSLKRTFDGTESEDPRAELKTFFSKIQGSFTRLEKCVELGKGILGQCSNELEDLRIQVVQLESLIEKTNSSEQQKSSNASISVQERNRLKKVSDQDIIEEITIEGSDHSDTSRRLSISKILEDRRKRQRKSSVDEEVLFISQEKNDYSKPGTSKEMTRITRSNTSQSHTEVTLSEEETIDSTMDVSAEDAVQTALLKTKGVLSTKELHTFLHLCDNVQDPVQLAKVSFTKDIKLLYFQLMTFQFYLKSANDTYEKLKDLARVNRELENKVKDIIHAFQIEIYREILPS